MHCVLAERRIAGCLGFEPPSGQGRDILFPGQSKTVYRMQKPVERRGIQARIRKRIYLTLFNNGSPAEVCHGRNQNVVLTKNKFAFLLPWG